MEHRINDSNYTLRWNRTSKEALGYSLKSWHFPPEDPNVGDRAVAIGCIVVTVLLGLIPFVFNIRLGG